jgi:hypothetical protein
VKIHVADGSIEFALGSVSRETDKSSFLASTLGQAAQAIVENGPYVTYRIDPEPGIGATLLFKDDRLENVAWALKQPDETDSGWSEDSEMRLKALHDAWLIGSLGEPPYRYPWGRIVSEYDAKAVSSAIIVVYER